LDGGDEITGDLLGCNVGDSDVGTLVGFGVGTSVSKTVGCLEGFLVGFLVGLLVGCLVGFLVGFLVGSLVGCTIWKDKRIVIMSLCIQVMYQVDRFELLTNPALLTLRVGYLVGFAVTGRFFSAGGCHEGRIDGRHSINFIVGLGLMIVDGLDPIFGSPWGVGPGVGSGVIKVT